MTSIYLEIAMIVFILMDSLMFGLYDYSTRSDYHDYNRILTGFNITFTVIYLLEACVKIISIGLFKHPNSYLRNGWHYYDIYIIIVGLLSAFPYLNHSRTLQVLCLTRILKLAYTSTAMNNLMTPWMLSLKQMGGVAMLVIFLLLVFSVIGHQMFKGMYYYRCRMTPEPINNVWELDSSIPRLCSAYGNGQYDCPASSYCGSPDMFTLPLSEENITELPESYYGTLNYDDTYKALLSSFQVITLDNWADVMYKAQDSRNSVLARIYFPLLAFIGAYFCLNLIVAIVFDTFQMFKGEMAEKEKALKEKEKEDLIDEPNEEDDDKKVKQIEGRSNSDEVKEKGGETTSTGLRLLSTKQKFSPKGVEDSPEAKGENPGVTYIIPNEICKEILTGKVYNAIMIILIIGNFVALAMNHFEITKEEMRAIDIADTVFFVIFVLEMLIGIATYGFVGYIKQPYYLIDFVINIFGLVEVILTYLPNSDSK